MDLRHILHNHYRKAIPFSILAILIGWYFLAKRFQLHPPTGTYIAILTFLAVFMTFRPPKEFWSKAVFIIIFGCFTIFEIHILYNDKREYINEQQNLSNSFKEIGENFKETSKNLGEILKEAKESREEESKQFTHLLERQEALSARQERLQKETLAKVKEREGILVPSNLPSPITHCSVPAGQMAVYFAGGAAWEMRFPFVLFQFRGKDIITLDKDQHGGFFVSTKILDDRGDLVVDIKKNKFIATYAASHLERTANSLVIYDHRGDEVFSVRFTNPYAFEISGKFYFNGIGLISDNKKLTIMPSGNVLSGICSSHGRIFLAS